MGNPLAGLLDSLDSTQLAGVGGLLAGVGPPTDPQAQQPDQGSVPPPPPPPPVTQNNAGIASMMTTPDDALRLAAKAHPWVTGLRLLGATLSDMGQGLGGNQGTALTQARQNIYDQAMIPVQAQMMQSVMGGDQTGGQGAQSGTGQSGAGGGTQMPGISPQRKMLAYMALRSGHPDQAAAILKPDIQVDRTTGNLYDGYTGTNLGPVGVALSQSDSGVYVNPHDPNMTGAVMPKPPVAGATPLFGPNGMQGGVQGWTLPNGTTQAVQQTAQAQSQGAAQGTANVQDSRTLVTIPDPANPGGTKVVTQGWLAANSGSAGGQAASSAPADGAVPRGLRNNNPLNLTPLPGKGSWAGQVGTDGDFAKFSTMQAGLAAADRNLLAKGTLHGLTTLNGIIADPRNGWDPGNQAYVTTVSKDMGIDPNTPLPITDPAFRQRLLASMEKVEVGKFAGSNGSAVPVQGTTAAPATAPGVLGGTAGAADTAFAQGQGTDLSTRIGQLTDAREGSIQARTNALQAQAFASSHPMNPGTPLAVNAANWLRTVDPKILSAAGFDPNKISNYANDAGIFNRVTNQVTLSAAKTLLPSRYTERELKLIPPITGSLTTPNEAMGVAAGTQAAIAGRQQAQADFASSYNGPKTRQAFEAAWAASPQGQRSIFQDPEAWKNVTFHGKPAVVYSPDGKWGAFALGTPNAYKFKVQ